MLDYRITFLHRTGIKVEWIEAETVIQAIAQLQNKYNRCDPSIPPSPGFVFGIDVEILSVDLQTVTPALTEFFKSKKH